MGVIYGDALERLRELPDESVQCCITSPPYWGLRDYSADGQLGLEKTPDEYISKMVEIFREVRRVLRADGTVFINLGDSYANTAGGTISAPEKTKNRASPQQRDRQRFIDAGLKPKDMCMIPARVAIALQADGWWLRSDIIWSKPNPMPSSVTDRPTTSHEYVYLLSKRARYFYDQDAIREEHAEPERGSGHTIEKNHFSIGDGNRGSQEMKRQYNPNGRNKRTVWTIATQGFPDSHFATYPKELVRTCLLAGTSPQACEHCGAPWERIVEITRPENYDPSASAADPKFQEAMSHYKNANSRPITKIFDDSLNSKRESKGWQPTCKCKNEGTGRSVVLDPFLGSGTTAYVAHMEGRDYVGIELQRDYEPMIRKRLGLFYKEG